MPGSSFNYDSARQPVGGPEEGLGKFFHGLELRLSEGFGFLHDSTRRIDRRGSNLFTNNRVESCFCEMNGLVGTNLTTCSSNLVDT